MFFLDRESPLVNFVLEVWQTLVFDSHYHAYEVKRTESIVISQQEGFLDYHPLVVNSVFDPALNSKHFVRLRFAYVP